MTDAELKARLARLVDSLDRVCSACLAATSAETWELLHRNRVCASRRPA